MANSLRSWPPGMAYLYDKRLMDTRIQPVQKVNSKPSGAMTDREFVAWRKAQLQAKNAALNVQRNGLGAYQVQMVYGHKQMVYGQQSLSPMTGIVGNLLGRL